MNKTARAQIVNHFYNLGMQSAMTKTAKPAAEVLKRTLRAAAPYAGVGGGALVGKNIAASAAADVQKAISASHLPEIQRALTEGVKKYKVSGGRMYDPTRLLTVAERNPAAALEEVMRTNILTSAGRGNVLEAVAKSLNQQELAEMGLLGAGIAGGGVLGHAALKDLRRHIR